MCKHDHIRILQNTDWTILNPFFFFNSNLEISELILKLLPGNFSFPSPIYTISEVKLSGRNRDRNRKIRNRASQQPERYKQRKEITQQYSLQFHSCDKKELLWCSAIACALPVKNMWTFSLFRSSSRMKICNGLVVSNFYALICIYISMVS